jgi:hypothetical protein
MSTTDIIAIYRSHYFFLKIMSTTDIIAIHRSH